MECWECGFELNSDLGDYYTVYTGHGVTGAFCDECRDQYAAACDCGSLYRCNSDEIHWCCDARAIPMPPRPTRSRAGIIHDYNFKPDFKYRSCGEKGNLLYMGVELEVDQGRERKTVATEIGKGWSEVLYTKRDGSLGEEGLEIVSHPATIAYHQTKVNWKGLLKLCKKHGYKSHDAGTCGLHVHVSRKALSSTDLLKLSSFVYQHEDEIQVFARRKKSSYAKMKKVDKAGDAKAMVMDGERMAALNMTNAATVEFRMCKGTLRYSTFMASLEFIHAVSMYVGTISTPVALRNIESWNGFCDFIARAKEYRFAEDYMKRHLIWRKEV